MSMIAELEQELETVQWQIREAEECPELVTESEIRELREWADHYREEIADLRQIADEIFDPEYIWF